MSYPPIAEASPPDESRITWGLRELLLSILVVIGAIVLSVAMVVVPVAVVFGTDSVETHVASALSSITLDLLAIWGMLLLVWRSGGTLQALGTRRPVRPYDAAREEGFPWGYYAGMVAVGLILSYVALVSYVVAIDALGLDFLKPSEQIPDDYLRSNAVVAVLAVAVVIVAPVCEELFFRGFVFGGLRPKMGFVFAGLTSGLIFSVAHQQFGLVLPFAAIGFIFAFLYSRTGSIFVSMTVHFLFNLISFSLLVANR